MATAGPPWEAKAAERRAPNIVFIFADDLGYQDVGYNGAEFYETPHLDTMAREGLVFDRFYPGAANCAPSRACIMTGQYTPRHGVYVPNGGARGDVDAMRWKVPLNKDYRPGRPAENANMIPTDTFPISVNTVDPDCGSVAEVLKRAGYVSARLGKWHIGDDNQGFDLSSAEGTPGFTTNTQGGVERRYYNDVNVAEDLTDAAVRFIEENRQRPFFLYLAHWEVHTPIVAAKDDIAYFREKRMQKGPWSKSQSNPVYAANIRQVDQSVGRVRAKLEELGLAENTLVLFASDNGGVPHISSNAPLRGGKGSFYEGGIRTPACAVWPGVVEPGRRTTVAVNGVDLMPTFAAIAAAPLPERQPVDGHSLLSLFHGEPEAALQQRATFFHFPLFLRGPGKSVPQPEEGAPLPIYGTDKYYWRAVPLTVIMKGPWKLLRYYEYDSIELYNLEDDPGERVNLAETHKERARAMLAEMENWVDETGAPVPSVANPRK